MALIEPLDPTEARVLGVLIEKQLTTPDVYPLSLNGLTNGCNQKSNRSPVMDLDEHEVELALDRLRLQQLVGEVRSTGSRVTKYQHTAREKLDVDGGALAVLAELLVRGVQQPGELRARASRMVKIADLAALEQHLAVLERLGYLVRLAPAAGSRAPRVNQTLCPSDDGPSAAPSVVPPAPSTAPTRDYAAPAKPQDDGTHAVEVRVSGSHASADLIVRVSQLEDEVRDLRAKLEKLSERARIPLE